MSVMASCDISTSQDLGLPGQLSSKESYLSVLAKGGFCQVCKPAPAPGMVDDEPRFHKTLIGLLGLAKVDTKCNWSLNGLKI